MAEIGSQVLEEMERCQTMLDRVEHKLDLALDRAADLDLAVSSTARRLADMRIAKQNQIRALEDMDRRLDRIERRLELTH